MQKYFVFSGWPPITAKLAETATSPSKYAEGDAGR